MMQTIYRLYRYGMLSELDVHFAGLMAGLDGDERPEVLLAAALVSSYTCRGHICLDLARLARSALLTGDAGADAIRCPDLSAWVEGLRRSPLVGFPGEFRPLILDGSARLYLYRYWEYQEKLAGDIMKRVAARQALNDPQALEDGLNRLFPAERRGGLDFQKEAARVALTKKICFISGGPGTGKTTTVARILALILEQQKNRSCRIALVAPTGKAASRLSETIRQAKERLDCSAGIKAAIPEDASTIHRLLGSVHGSPYFRYNEKNKLPADVVVVDEASMVDLALMSKLVCALSPETSVMLLGDRYQLASVEAGAVLGDICEAGDVDGTCKGADRPSLNGGEKERISSCIVYLAKSYRFGGASGIGALSRAVNEGDGMRALTLFEDERHSDIAWISLPEPEALACRIRDAVIRGFSDYLAAPDVLERFKLFDRFRILCALRKGPYGTVAVNMLVERILKEEGLIRCDSRWYAGRPVMVTKNDYNVRLFNGDVGLILPACGPGHGLRAFFPAAGGGVRSVHPLRLPEHETAYAITVHKSQGSEFERTLVLLPDRDTPALTRELVYTGITRAMKHVEIWGKRDLFRTALLRRVERMSGLRDALLTGRT